MPPTPVGYLGAAALPYCPQPADHGAVSLTGNRGVVAGLRKAKAQGKQLGRPRTVLNRRQIARLRAEGKSWEAVADRLGVSRSTLHRHQGFVSQTPRDGR